MQVSCTIHSATKKRFAVTPYKNVHSFTMLRVGLLLAVAIGLLPSNANAAPPYEIEVHKDVLCGQAGNEPLTLHWARPRQVEGSTPAIVIIHGGGWRGGSKNSHLAEMEQIAELGYFAASIGYRLAPAHQFPAQLHDCKCAIRWLRAHADELRIDPERIGAVGGSAGAHLAMLLGTLDEAGLEGDGGWPEHSSKVQAVVAYFGPTSMIDEYKYSANARLLANLARTTDRLARQGNGQRDSDLVRMLEEAASTVTDFLGGTPAEQPEAYRLASPLLHVDASDAPMLIYHGTLDLLVPYQQSLDMIAALTKAGVPGRVEIVLGGNHGFEPAEHQRSMRGAMEFFATHLGTPSSQATSDR